MATRTDGDIMTVKECVKALIKEAGDYKRVMVKLGIGQTRVYGFTDPNSDEEISFARVAALTSAESTAAARYLAQLAGGVFCPVPKADQIGAVMERIAGSAKSHGGAISETVKAIADGMVTAAESAAVRAEIRKAISDLVSLERALDVTE